MAVFGETVTAQAWAQLAQAYALTTVLYTQVPAPVRNLVTGQATAAGTTTTVPMLLRQFRRDELDGTAVVAGDQLARIPKTTLAVSPTTRDRVTIDGVAWSIVTLTDGANGGWWRMQLRRPRAV